MTSVQEVVEVITDILDDQGLPKNIKSKLEMMVANLKNSNPKTLRLAVDKSVSELDEICNDTNIQTFTRTQLWGIVSMLEGLEH